MLKLNPLILFGFLPIYAVFSQVVSETSLSGIESSLSSISSISPIESSTDLSATSTVIQDNPSTTSTPEGSTETNGSDPLTSSASSTILSLSSSTASNAVLPTPIDVEKYEGLELGEPDHTPPEYTAEDRLDLTAHQLNTYANDVATGEHAVIADGDPISSVVVLPSCPDIAALADGNDKVKRATKKKTYDCTPKSLTIKVHFHYVGSKDEDVEDANLVTINARVNKNVSDVPG